MNIRNGGRIRGVASVCCRFLGWGNGAAASLLPVLTGDHCQQLPKSFQALRAEVPDDGGMRRVIGWLWAAATLIFGSAYAALRQLGRRSAKAAPAAAVAARVKLVDLETRSRE